MTAIATSGDASATEFAAAQNFGTSSTAATISRASRCGSLTPSASSIDVQPASKSPMVPMGSVVGKYRALPLLTELLLHVGNLEGLDERIDVSIEDFRQLVQREIDPVVGDAVLRIVVGADLRRSIAGANLRLSHPRARRFLLGDFRIEQSGAQHFHCLQLVLQL